jgi:ribosomal protein S18 acetylase RimI-like enzyme
MSAAPAIRIRKETPEDASYFREVEFQTTWENLDAEEQARFTPARVREALQETHEILLDRPGNTIFIAESEDGQRAGLLWFGERRNLATGEIEAWIYNVTVSEAFRGQGVGALLMQHAEAFARDEGYRTIGLMVALHNRAARRLYERLDYHKGNLLMRKRLAK